MKTLSALLSAILLAAGLAVAGPAPAANAANRPCVTRAEYRAIHANQTPTRVRQIVGSAGTTVYDNDAGYYEGAWVEVYDWVENWSGGYDVDGYPIYDWEWQVVDYDWDEYAGGYVSLRDVIRTFNKCWTRGKASVWYDDYTQTGSGLRVYSKATYNLGTLMSGRSGPISKAPDAPARPAEPSVEPPVAAPQR